LELPQKLKYPDQGRHALLFLGPLTPLVKVMLKMQAHLAAMATMKNTQ
jgi:hypothetical protein